MTTLIGFCHICGKKLKGENKQGLMISRGKHYINVHGLNISIVENGHIQVIYIVPARTLTF
ncbi:hypothetical protein Ngar_c03570 [Candidatus Nitrososphaera gargensis Ga9.2]|uniref:Uncharacterized protein n=1 Tax=Nitrososphaera gargensis (strain Ga9.2) TaxID=1237085 RepID=K0I7P6_NITGG|nr:hypothetical protein [Candidatus Nitrososphaera gargensis]AFU57276.1 hypothetical protein Ngar_c03280 [Candidatus Nitrososphaera gargensis Ga9.2]AFU57305.1 hypothetical protein Ngar_c03570 [Candidatus Nitrososphaera gargensis Ga9.2]